MSEDPKRTAARAALDEMPQSGIVGLGSGSTARLFVEELGARVRAGLRVSGVPTSESTKALAVECGIPLLAEEGPWDIDVNVDGADEVSAAHTREKIINYAAKKNVVIVDGSKLSTRLGERWPVPTEVLPFAHGATRAHLEKHGRPKLRTRPDGSIVHTDAGNLIYDLATGPIDSPASLDRALHSIPGVVETGLFVGRADVVIVAEASGVRRLTRG